LGLLFSSFAEIRFGWFEVYVIPKLGIIDGLYAFPKLGIWEGS
jgi:hypothetical protein